MPDSVGMAMLAIIALTSCAVLVAAHIKHSRQRRIPRRRGLVALPSVKRQRKPEWVVRQLVLLKAHLPEAGCRTIATTFNRVFAHRTMTVSKSYVHCTLSRHAHEVLAARAAIRRARPKPAPVNHCWGVDLTGMVDESGAAHTMLGILDHGSRAAVALHTVPRKCSWTLLGYLCLAIARFGRPRAVRTDNERCFTGRVFSTGLRLLEIGHERIDLHCPWQNGRVERFFGTLKPLLRRISVRGREELESALRQFAGWYNGVRPHANLAGATPREAWHGIDPYCVTREPNVQFVEAWDGLLGGFRIRR